MYDYIVHIHTWYVWLCVTWCAAVGERVHLNGAVLHCGVVVHDMSKYVDSWAATRFSCRFRRFSANKNSIYTHDNTHSHKVAPVFRFPESHAKTIRTQTSPKCIIITGTRTWRYLQCVLWFYWTFAIHAHIRVSRTQTHTLSSRESPNSFRGRDYFVCFI